MLYTTRIKFLKQKKKSFHLPCRTLHKSKTTAKKKGKGTLVKFLKQKQIKIKINH